MALYPGMGNIESGNYGKTHTKLELSNGQAPAEKFVVSRQNEFKPFIYEYGPAGHQSVILPKGKLVEAVGTEYNPRTGFEETAIKTAENGSTAVLGVNQHNIYDVRRGVLEGTAATVLGRSYIEVPLFESDDAGAAGTTAEAMKFGAAYGASGELQPGDYVVAGLDGNFRKYVKGTDAVEAIVGKVWGVTRELPPSGALQYYTGLQGEQLKDFIDGLSGYAGAGDEAKPGHPYSNGAWLPEFLKTIGTGEMKGIPFLTDGYFSAKEELTTALDDKENIEVVRAQDAVTVNGSTLTVAEDVNEAMIVVKLAHQIDPLETGDITVKSTEGDFSKRDVHVDLSDNAIVLYLEGGKTYKNVEITVSAVVNPTAGIPTEWDHKGSVGAVRILLNQ